MKIQKQIEVAFPITIILFFVGVFAWGCEHQRVDDLEHELGLSREYNKGCHEHVLDLSHKVYEAEKEIERLKNPQNYAYTDTIDIYYHPDSIKFDSNGIWVNRDSTFQIKRK